MRDAAMKEPLHPNSGLDKIEERLSALILNQFADEFAEAMDIVAQRLVLLGEENLSAGNGI